MSDGGTHAVSVIGFIESVFSPWYAWSGRRDPANHCCINVVTYGPDASHIWRPLAPSARIEVDLSQGNTWSGHGYFDANFGTAALGSVDTYLIHNTMAAMVTTAR